MLSKIASAKKYGRTYCSSRPSNTLVHIFLDPLDEAALLHHFVGMSRVSNRDRILEAGLQVVHEHGYANASVRDIVAAAGVPQGSFTNHFASKEAFGLEIIDHYLAATRDVLEKTLLDETRQPLQRLEACIDTGRDLLNADCMRRGCMLGNFTAEASAESEQMRNKLLSVFDEIEAAYAHCLRAAVQAGEVPADLDVKETAALIVQSLQGANLLAKAHRDPTPVDRFKKTLFEKILK